MIQFKQIKGISTLLHWLGYAFGCVSTITLSITFYTAYFSANKMTIVSVDSLGEGNIEAMVVIPIVIITTIFGIIYNKKEVK